MSGGSKSQTSTQQVEPPAYLQPYLQQLANQSTQAYNQGQLGYVAPFTPEQIQAQRQLLNYAQGPAAQQIPQGVQSAYLNALQLSQDPTKNPYLAGTVNAAIQPLTQQFQQTVLPGISDQSVVSGNVGQSREGIAQGIAGQQYLQGVGNISNSIYNQALTQGLQLVPQLTALGPTVQQLQLSPASILEAVGSTRQQQQQLEGGQQQQALQAWAALLSAGSPGSTTTFTGPANTTSPLLGALGGAATGASVGAIGGPYGAGIGAGLGALIGFFGSQ